MPFGGVAARIGEVVARPMTIGSTRETQFRAEDPRHQAGAA